MTVKINKHELLKQYLPVGFPKESSVLCEVRTETSFIT